MTTPSRDPSVDHEPHRREVAPSDERLSDEPALRLGPVATPKDVDHSIWHEPAFQATLPDRPRKVAEPTPLSYADWLDAHEDRVSWRASWTVAAILAIAAGPWGVLGAVVSSFQVPGLSTLSLLATVVFAPVTEEITKVAALLWVVEKRPYWLKSMTQVLLCAAAGGLVFAAIENLLYLSFYNPDGGEAYAQWRWTVCTALHVNCSVIAGFGLVRIWDKALRTRTRPDLRLGMPLFTLAMVTHGLYNLGVTVAELAGWLDF